jgi:hypothetical protein
MKAKRPDGDYWRERAEEARIQAEEVRSSEAKHTLLQIAKDYDRLAACSVGRKSEDWPLDRRIHST